MQVIEFSDINTNIIRSVIWEKKLPEIGDIVYLDEVRYKVTGVHKNRVYNKIIVVVELV